MYIQYRWYNIKLKLYKLYALYYKDSILVSCGYDQNVILWNVDNFELIGILRVKFNSFLYVFEVARVVVIALIGYMV